MALVIPRRKARRRIRPNGYVEIRIGDQIYFEHRVVMETFLRRKLHPDETVHHRNGDRRDNRIENLELIQRGVHSRIKRGPVTSKWETVECRRCRAPFVRRIRVTEEHPRAYCSRACYVADAHNCPGRNRTGR